jgi:hypothetical protein
MLLGYAANHTPVDLMHGSGLATCMVGRRRLRIHRFVVDHAGVVHEHRGLVLPVDDNRLEAIAADEPLDFRDGRLALVDGLAAIDADEFVLPLLNEPSSPTTLFTSATASNTVMTFSEPLRSSLPGAVLFGRQECRYLIARPARSFPGTNVL